MRNWISGFTIVALAVISPPANAQETNAGTQETGQQSQQQPPRPRPFTAADIDRMRNLLVDQNGAVMLGRQEVGKLRDRTLDTQYAITRPGYSNKGQPMPRRRDLVLSPTPDNGAPNRIYLAQGIVSAISFIDERGRPWPIENTVYDPQMLAVNGNGCGETQAPAQAEAGADRPHVLYVMPCKFWSWSNLVVKLEKTAVPMIFQTESGSEDEGAFVDMAVDIKVKAKSPGGKNRSAVSLDASDKNPQAASLTETFTPDKTLDDFLNSVPPEGARSVRVGGDNSAEAWLYRGALYLKTANTVMNPAHDARASLGGMYVWRFDRPVPRIRTVTADGVERVFVVDY